MVGGDPDVLVEVERGELRPVDPGLLPQRRQELVLRGRGGEDDGGPARRARGGRGWPRPPRGPRRAPSWAGSGRPPRAGGRRRGPARPCAPSRAARAARRRPSARKCGSATSGLLDLRVPALLPLEGDPARRRPPPCSQSSDAGGREVAAAGQGRRPRDLPVRRAPRVLEVDVAQEGPERRRRPSSGSSPNSEKALAGSHTAPSPSLPASSRRERVAAAGREVAVRLEPDLDAACRGGGRAGRRGTRRSSRASRRDRRPAARGRRTRGCPGAPRRAATSAVRSASSTARRRAAGSGLWKKERVSTQGTARPASARRASVSRRPAPVSSGRAQSASSPSTKRSSTPS